MRHRRRLHRPRPGRSRSRSRIADGLVNGHSAKQIAKDATLGAVMSVATLGVGKIAGPAARAAAGKVGAALRPRTMVHANFEGAEAGSALANASRAALRAAEDPASIFVKNKHQSSAGGNGAKFASDDISEVQGWIARGLQSDSVQFLPNQLDDTFRAIVPGGGPIGTRGQEYIRVIVTGDGRVINAFPVNVR